MEKDSDQCSGEEMEELNVSHGAITSSYYVVFVW